MEFEFQKNKQFFSTSMSYATSECPWSLQAVEGVSWGTEGAWPVPAFADWL